jgi:hypothetical protein
MNGWLRPRSRVVEHSTHNPKFDGSNPATGTKREKMPKKKIITRLGHFRTNLATGAAVSRIAERV